MSKYFYDCEFLEGTQKGWFGKSKPTIDLISIGMVSETGREYYAILKDFNLKEAWNRYDEKVNTDYNPSKEESHYNPMYIRDYWIRENVLKPIFMELTTENILDGMDFTYSNFKKLVNKYCKTNKQIAEEIKEFVYKPYKKDWIKETLSEICGFNDFLKRKQPIEFYAYYADYDWVAFCWLFGKMIDLPTGFPMYCNDLKQTLDEKVNSLLIRENQSREFHNRPKYTFNEGLKEFKTRKGYPKQTNEHNALADAKWNKELYNFINSL